jgi:uncharacterized membrane protein
VFAVVFLLLVPGAVIAAASPTRPSEGAVRFAMAAAASAVYLMLVALVADLVLPRVGIEEPLARAPLLISVDLSLAILLVAVSRRRDPLAALLGTRVPTARQVSVIAALAALPLLSTAGSRAVDNGRGPALLVLVLVACGVLLVALVVAGDRMPSWFVQAGLYVVAVAIVYSFAFSGDRLYGWDIQQEFDAFATTMQANTWHGTVDGDAYRAMLSITALPTALTRLTGMSGVALFRGVYPLLFAAFPVLVYVVAGRWLPSAAARAAAAFLIVQLAFAQQLPAIARQEVALLVFGVLVAVASDDMLPLGYRRVVALTAGCALAFVHYSTAYVTSLVLLVAWVVGATIASVRRRGRPPTVFVLPVVAAILGFTVVWNFVVTQSSENVFQFSQQVAERGPEFLPGGQDRSMVDRWLTGNTPQRIAGEEYAARIDQIFAATAPWLNGYPADEIAAHPVVDARAPQVAGPLPGTRSPHATLLVFVSQGYLALTSLGVLVCAWLRRRDRSAAREMALIGVVMLVFVSLMRVSGVAAEAYNQERAQIHGSVLLSIGFATLVAWLLARWRRATLAVVAAAVTVVFLASSGLAARLGGGASPANLVDAGEARERFSVTDAEVATAEWLAANRHPDSLVYADRYGKLRIWAASVPIRGGALQDALTPGTLDRNAYVFASESNIAGGRARGAIGADYAVYEFPRAFLDANKAAIYSTGSTVVYR